MDEGTILSRLEVQKFMIKELGIRIKHSGSVWTFPHINLIISLSSRGLGTIGFTIVSSSVRDLS
jgi:hypothetical protein